MGASDRLGIRGRERIFSRSACIGWHDNRLRNAVNGVLMSYCLIVANLTDVNKTLSAFIFVGRDVFPVDILGIWHFPCAEALT